ncbi:MAG TPA: hypothetical protein DCX07_15025, partial [Phycisphaerales bacterium]|nr:hypothetical protein [Phycisphaerales bacterium]
MIDTDELLGGGFLPAGHNPLPEVQASAPEAQEAPTEMTPTQKAEALKALDEGEVRACTLCGLHRTRTHTVFGEGSPSAALVFVGEGPGADEDAT